MELDMSAVGAANDFFEFSGVKVVVIIQNVFKDELLVDLGFVILVEEAKSIIVLPEFLSKFEVQIIWVLQVDV